MKQVMTDYRMNLVELLHDETEQFHNVDVKNLFEYSQALQQGDMERIEKLSEKGTISREVLYMICSVTKANELLIQLENQEVEDADMCKFISDLVRDSKAEGERRGKLEEKIVLIIKKLKKNKSLEIIADELELEIRELSELLKVISNFAPDYDRSLILDIILRK